MLLLISIFGIVLTGMVSPSIDQTPATCVDGIKNQGEEKVDCGGPCWSCDPPLNGVSCGAHSAPTCAECPQDHGPSWCNGQCTWDYTESKCVKLEKEVFCGSNEDCVATETCDPESTSNMLWISDLKEKFTEDDRKEMLKEAGRNYYILKRRYGNSSPRFAQSVWLDYSKEGFSPEKWQVIKKNGWIFEDSVIVQKSVPNTYFSTVVFGGGYSGIQQHPSESCGITEGFCGVFIFSLWNDGSNHASLVTAGEDVYIEDFGGEGTGIKSMKFVNWKPNQEVITAVEGTWDSHINGWTVECSFTIGETVHFMAKFQRPGDHGMQDNFQFSSFIEDWDRNEYADGCLYKRSATFLVPKIYYVEDGERKIAELNITRFTKDQGQNQDFCKEWSCADSGINFFSLTTGGARLGKPDETCWNDEIFNFDPNFDPILTGPLQQCV